jgi:hypothetical protein
MVFFHITGTSYDSQNRKRTLTRLNEENWDSPTKNNGKLGGENIEERRGTGRWRSATRFNTRYPGRGMNDSET